MNRSPFTCRSCGTRHFAVAVSALALFAFSPTTFAYAQQAPPAPASPAAPPAAAPAPPVAPAPVAIPDGTAIKVTLQTEMKSGVAKEGDQVPFTVSNDVLDANGKVLVKAGTPALGHVTASSHRGMIGKPGKLEFTCDYVAQPDGTHISLRNSEKTKYGQDNRTATVAAAVLLTPVALLIKGNDVTARQGQQFTMYVNTTASAAGVPAGKSSFLLNDGTSVVGTVSKFDGTTYTVHTDSGDRTLKASDVKTVSPVK